MHLRAGMAGEGIRKCYLATFLLKRAWRANWNSHPWLLSVAYVLCWSRSLLYKKRGELKELLTDQHSFCGVWYVPNFQWSNKAIWFHIYQRSILMHSSSTAELIHWHEGNYELRSEWWRYSSEKFCLLMSILWTAQTVLNWTLVSTKAANFWEKSTELLELSKSFFFSLAKVLEIKIKN